jgi:integrase
MENNVVNISRSLTETKNGLFFKPPKSGKSRALKISNALVEVLRRHRVNQDADKALSGTAYEDTDLAFAMPGGKPVLPWTFTASFRYLVERAGVPRIRLHDLRDTHASLLAKAGVPIEVISKRLGHADISITAERYMHVFLDRDAEAAGAFERLLAPRSADSVRRLLDSHSKQPSSGLKSLVESGFRLVAPTGIERVGKVHGAVLFAHFPLKT